MNPLGLYFGPRMVCIAQSKNRGLINSTSIPQSKIMGQDFQEKVPEEIKMSILFKEELKRSHIEAPEATIVVSGRDLIIRTFDMPVIPQNELYNALSFEVRKYIPFRVEDLAFDFQVLYDRSTKKNFVLFTGIKKDILNKYLAILKQLGMKATTIDYSGFSILRLLPVANIKQTGIMAVVDIDLIEEDEINFMVLQNGFPLFSRDIVLPSESTYESVKTGKFDVALSMDKFKSELRVSLDFYHRKFPTKKIEKIFFVCSEEFSAELVAFAKEKNLTAVVLNFKKYLPKDTAFSSSLVKAYGGSLYNILRTNIKIDILNTKFRKPGTTERAAMPYIASQLFPEFKISPKAVLAGVAICLSFFIYGVFQKLPLEKNLRTIIDTRPKVTVVSPAASVKELKDFSVKFKKKIDTLRNILKKKIYVTSVLDSLPKLLPDGLWLTSVSYRGDIDKAEFLIHGQAFLNDSDKEMQAINSFFTALQKKNEVIRYFSFIAPPSVDHVMLKKTSVANFNITLRND